MGFNSTFRGGNPFWANACVGNNGNPGYVEYSKGFSQAANLLINMVIADEGRTLHVDDLIYPICFNMRHSVELRLKDAIKDLHIIAQHKNMRINFNIDTSHDIGNIWEAFKIGSESIDCRFLSINKQIEPTIKDIANVDATGQTFRYPFSNESKKHLTEVANINFIVLRNKFFELENWLDKLRKLNNYLCEEYLQGTFTSKLNRLQLYKVATKLPEKSKWGYEEFDSIKKNICKEYGLSNNDFSKAVTKIKEHYYLSSLIGAPRPLLGIDSEDLITFLDCWSKLHPYDNSASSALIHNLSNIEIDELFKEWEREATITNKIWVELSPKFTHEFLAGIRALFYFARDIEFAERYPAIYCHEMDSIKNLERETLRQLLTDIINKTNAHRNIVTSLFGLGRTDLAEALMARYCLEKHHIEKLRTRTIFSYPEIAGYGEIA